MHDTHRAGRNRCPWRRRRSVKPHCWPRNAADCITAADALLRVDPQCWSALYRRAQAAAELGRPHRALSDLARIFFGSSDAAAPPIDTAVLHGAEASFAHICREQADVLRSMACVTEGEDPSKASTTAAATADTKRSSMCVYRVDAGNLLFREGVAQYATARSEAAYSPVTSVPIPSASTSSGAASTVAPLGLSGPLLLPVEGPSAAPTVPPPASLTLSS